MTADTIGISARRAQVFSDGANEISKIGTVKKEELVRGLVGVPLDAIHRAVGKSERDTAKADPQVLSLLSETLADVLGTKVRGPAHLYNLVKTHIPEEATIHCKKASERLVAERVVRRIAEKLVNGHAGVWI